MVKEDIRAKRIELLKKYHPVDEINKVVTLKLYYQHASDLLDYTIGETGKETFKDEFIDKISSLFERLPVDYKADVVLQIEDYDVYNEQIIMDKFNDFLMMCSYDARYASKKNGFKSTILAIAGCIILTINAIFTTFNILGNGELLSNVLKEALDITSWVFIWQAVTNLFILYNDDYKSIMIILNKLNRFSLSRNGEIKLTRSIEDISKDCSIDSSFSKAQKQVLAVSSSLLFFEGMVMIVESIITLINQTIPIDYHTPIIQLVTALLLINSGIFSLCKFTNHKVQNWKVILCFSLSTIMVVVVLIHDVLMYHNFYALINVIFSFALLGITFVLSYFYSFKGFNLKLKKHGDK